jgi:hypothetical protein
MHRRTTAAGLTVVALTFAVSGCAVRPTGTQTPHPGASTSATPVTPLPTSTAVATLGPDGYAGLTLGMSKTQALATGVTTGISDTSGTCGADGDGRLQGALPADSSDLDGKLFFSINTGKLVIIGATSSIATPQGVHLGSSVKDVKKAYPKWKGSEGDEGDAGLGFIKVPGNPQAVYRIYIDAGQVMELTLQANDQDCAE